MLPQIRAANVGPLAAKHSTFAALAMALDALEIARPASWTHAFVIRRCAACTQIQVIKDDVYECAVCGATLAPRG